MIDLVDVIFKDLSTDEDYKSINDLIGAKLNDNHSQFLKKTYDTFYRNNDPEKVYLKIKRMKHRRKINEWYAKAIEGYNDFIKNKEIKRGFYRHLVDHFLSLKKLEAEMGENIFQKMLTVSDPEKILLKWKESEDSYLIEYPFFDKISLKIQENAIEIDMIILIGKWLLSNLERVNILATAKNPVLLDKLISKKEKQFVEKAPATVLEHPWFGPGGNVQYSIDENHEISQNFDKLDILEERTPFELPSRYKMAIDPLAIEVSDMPIKTPDMKDRQIFSELLNFRDKNFQQNRRVHVYLADLIKTSYSTDSLKVYTEMRNRLFRLGYFRLLNMKENGSFDIRYLFSKMTVDQDRTGKWYVSAYVGEDVHDHVLKEQFINIYDKKIKELKFSNNLAYHLSFLIQKERILKYEPNLTEIKFELTWTDFSTSMRFNKRSKRENMDEVAKALEAIKSKDFLVKNVERYHPYSFVITCYALNNYELEDMNKVKLTFDEPIQELLIGQ